MPLADHLRRGMEAVKAKTDKALMVSKLQNEISVYRSEIHQERKILVDTVFELYKAGAELPVELMERCQNIAELEKSILEKQDVITNILASQRPEPQNSMEKNPLEAVNRSGVGDE